MPIGYLCDCLFTIAGQDKIFCIKSTCSFLCFRDNTISQLKFSKNIIHLEIFIWRCFNCIFMCKEKCTFILSIFNDSFFIIDLNIVIAVKETKHIQERINIVDAHLSIKRLINGKLCKNIFLRRNCSNHVTRLHENRWVDCRTVLENFNSIITELHFKYPFSFLLGIVVE